MTQFVVVRVQEGGERLLGVYEKYEDARDRVDRLRAYAGATGTQVAETHTGFVAEGSGWSVEIRRANEEDHRRAPSVKLQVATALANGAGLLLLRRREVDLGSELGYTCYRKGDMEQLSPHYRTLDELMNWLWGYRAALSGREQNGE